MNSRERFTKALRSEPIDRPPLFPLFMFFAADRAGLKYGEYATNGRALAQAQLQMLDRWGLDAITACSDAFRLPADLGGDMLYPEDRTPSLAEPLVTCEADLDRLDRGVFGETVRKLRHRLGIATYPLGGLVGRLGRRSQNRQS